MWKPACVADTLATVTGVVPTTNTVIRATQQRLGHSHLLLGHVLARHVVVRQTETTENNAAPAPPGGGGREQHGSNSHQPQPLQDRMRRDTHLFTAVAAPTELEALKPRLATRFPWQLSLLAVHAHCACWQPHCPHTSSGSGSGSGSGSSSGTNWTIAAGSFFVVIGAILTAVGAAAAVVITAARPAVQ